MIQNKLSFLRICLETGSSSGTPRTGWRTDQSSAARTISQVDISAFLFVTL
jgi:hypothetical protein